VNLLAVGIVALVLAANVHWPARRRPWLGLLSFVAGSFTTELAFHALFLLTVVVALLVRAGALATRAGQVGLGLSLAAAALLLIACVESARTRGVVERILGDLPRSSSLGQLLFPIPLTPSDVERIADVTYYKDENWDLKLDIFRRRGDIGAARRPALIFCHGGGYVMGHRRYLGLPTMHHMAARGWVCFNIQYRLSPRATYPDPLVDAKRVIAWVRAHADEWGVDPSFIVISGNSAGAHLAALAALTPNQAVWQPGFEEADTRVQACIAYYGVYDLANLSGPWSEGVTPMVYERYVFKQKVAEAQARFAEASPSRQVGPEAPPFLVVHGTHDTIVPVEEARQFVAALGERAVYLEFPGAQHAFDTFPSLRTAALLDGVERFTASCLQARKR
jgi:acetyl esterase/lipase